MSRIIDRRRVMGGKSGIDWRTQPLTFEMIEDGTVSLKKFNQYGFENNIKYSLDWGKTWTTLPFGSATPILSAGTFIQFKLNSTQTDVFVCDAKFNVMGNLMSIFYEDNFEDALLPNKSYAVLGAFTRTSVVSAEDLVLPSNTRSHAYNYTFAGCSYLTVPPKLPATTLADNCYSNMFSNCTSLVIAPELSATKLAPHCCNNMFASCTSLVSAPELPVTTLADSCYADMFSNCTSLVTPPELPATTLANNCYARMFYECFNLETSPILRANTLVRSCYNYMFTRCRKLRLVYCYATDIQGTSYWLYDVAAGGTFVKHPDATWTTGSSGIPSSWTVEDAIIDE